MKSLSHNDVKIRNPIRHRIPYFMKTYDLRLLACCLVEHGQGMSDSGIRAV